MPIVKTSELTEALKQVITTVFIYEDSFLTNIYPNGKKDELLEFYMGDECCRVVLLTWSGQTYVDSVKTLDVLNWYNEMEKIL